MSTIAKTERRKLASKNLKFTKLFTNEIRREISKKYSFPFVLTASENNEIELHMDEDELVMFLLTHQAELEKCVTEIYQNCFYNKMYRNTMYGSITGNYSVVAMAGSTTGKTAFNSIPHAQTVNFNVELKSSKI